MPDTIAEPYRATAGSGQPGVNSLASAIAKWVERAHTHTWSQDLVGLCRSSTVGEAVSKQRIVTQPDLLGGPLWLGVDMLHADCGPDLIIFCQ